MVIRDARKRGPLGLTSTSLLLMHPGEWLARRNHTVSCCGHCSLSLSLSVTLSRSCSKCVRGQACTFFFKVFPMSRFASAANLQPALDTSNLKRKASAMTCIISQEGGNPKLEVATHVCTQGRERFSAREELQGGGHVRWVLTDSRVIARNKPCGPLGVTCVGNELKYSWPPHV